MNSLYYYLLRVYVSAQTRNLPVHTGTGIPISGTNFQYCPFLNSTSGNFPLVPVPKRAICRIGTERDSFVPFPELGSASSGTVIHWAPYRNWTLSSARKKRAEAFLSNRTALERRVRKRFSLGFGITLLVTEQVPEPENEENEWSTQYRKWDFALPVLVPVLEMGLPFPVR